MKKILGFEAKRQLEIDYKSWLIKNDKISNAHEAHKFCKGFLKNYDPYLNMSERQAIIFLVGELPHFYD